MAANEIVSESVAAGARKWFASQDINGDNDDNQVTELFVGKERREATREEAKALKSVDIDKVDLQWVQVLAEGWAHPLKGFMREEELLRSLHFSCLSTGEESVNHSVPIVLAVSREDKERLEDASAFSLRQGKVFLMNRNSKR